MINWCDRESIDDSMASFPSDQKSDDTINEEHFYQETNNSDVQQKDRNIYTHAAD